MFLRDDQDVEVRTRLGVALRPGPTHCHCTAIISAFRQGLNDCNQSIDLGSFHVV